MTASLSQSRGEALHAADVRRQPARGRRPGGRPRAGGPGQGLGAGGVRLRLPHADGLPGRQDRDGRDRVGDPQHLLAHAERDPADRRRPRQRVAGPGDPRPRRQRTAGDRGVPRGQVRQAARPHPGDRRPGPPWAASRDAHPRRDLHAAPARGRGHRARQAAQAADQAPAPYVPIWIASLGQKNVEATAEYADGWLPIFFRAREGREVWGDALAAGKAKRPEGLGPLEISAGGMVAIGEGPETKALLDFARPYVRAVRRRHGRARQELLQRPGLPVRLREGGQGDPGPVPERQQARRREGRPARALEWATWSVPRRT